MDYLDTSLGYKTSTQGSNQTVVTAHSLLLTTLPPQLHTIPYILQLIDLRLYIQASLFLIALPECTSQPLHSVKPCSSPGPRVGRLKGKQTVIHAPMVAAATSTTRGLPFYLPSTACCSQSHQTW